MRQGSKYRPLYGLLLSLLAGIAIPTSGALAKATNDPAPPPVRAGSFAGAYLAGRTAESDNNLATAVDFYRQAMAFDPGNAQIKQDLLLVLLTEGRFKDALPLAEELKNVPDIERFSRVALAIDAIDRKQYRKVGQLLMLSLQSDMDRLATGFMSAWVKVGQGNPKQALADIQKMQGPEWYGLFRTYNSALIADLAGQKQEARDFYQQAIDDRPGGSAAPDTYERIVMAYASFKLRQGDKEGAIKTLNDAAELLNGRMTITEMREKIEAGEKYGRLIKTAQEGTAEALYTLGTAINRSGAEAFAKLYLQMSLPLRPDNDATLYQLGDISAKLRQPEKAIDYYGRVPEKSPYRRDAEMQRALNLAENDQSADAVKQLRVLLDRDKTDMRTYLALGGVYAQDKNFADAAKIYDAAVEQIKTPERKDWPVFYQRGIAYERLKQWDKAEPNFRKALELYPDQPQVLNYLGYSWVDRGENLDEALGMIKKAVELRPQDGYIVDSLGWAYYMLGRYDEAVVELEKAVKLRPEDPTINDHMGDAYWRVGRLLEATFQWNHAIAGKPEPEDLVKIEAKLKKGLPDIPGQSSADAAKPDEKKPVEQKPEAPEQSPAPAAPSDKAPEKPATD
ncbi:tetratricopeptide repeat protein [Brucella anthropi]|uniref:Tetratricopeptide TPR_2 repeat protein n=1 Tax=Brucella anthropi (strain ATCC 49188 / DSM 6882 / CCUG 24695 / JCM 21032 / LMG 3331 / NBRC 15819 / NCTC 12168 / Alc 37) TaxID=439375 RepID=A6WW97_BRUA4|nr:tetratricopeptide repeat protein [Brucella anthropi]ABS13251.1 Tetratricopeptide TPR_2 repeat protein [Brucella anthropi ATCC 49188]QQC24511.1 tetratricopeptide repeat protein [Brucella anthropi]SUA60924.1 lipoprotein NlpI [Brucella anthropi]